MIQKVISLSTAAVIASVYLWSQLQPSGVPFLFASSNLAVNIFLLGLAWVMVKISFMNSFKTDWGYTLAAGGAIFGLLIGSFGLFSSGFDYVFYSFFGPVDFVFLTQAGVILSIAALSYTHKPVNLTKPAIKLPQLSIQRPSLSQPRLANHSYKLLHFG